MRARGFSLIELTVALGVSLLAVAAGVALMVASHRSFQSGSDERGMQETGRVALDELTSHLREAGYGLEPTFVIDPGPIATTVMDRVPVGMQARFGGYQCPQNNATCRDSITGPDELVFYSRDPLFERDVTGVGVNAITLAGPPSGGATTLLPGQVLQLMCYGAAAQWIWTYVTVASTNVTNPAAPVVTIQAASGLPYDFPLQNALLGQPCFTTAGAIIRAFKIDRYRYYVQAVNDAGQTQPWETPGTHPYLMLDQGLSSGGNAIVTAVAPDVEDLQVAYVFPLAPVGAQVLGATQNLQIAANGGGDDSGFNLAPLEGIPSFTTPSLDPLRTTHHPSNVRAVRISLTVRSPRADPRVSDALIRAQFNRPDVAGEAGYRRQYFESTVYIHNMETRLPVFPTYDPTYTTANCCTGTTCSGNCGGG